MGKYRKKPIVIEAVQFFPDIKPWPVGVIEVEFIGEGDSRHANLKGELANGWFINTLEGGHEVTPGDWIITGIAGEKYPCKPDIFEATYDEVHDAKTDS